MITAALNTVAINPAPAGETPELTCIVSEIAARLDEMHEIKFGSGADLVTRLATVARHDAGAYALAVAVLHGDTGRLLESYAVQGEKAGREKQTIHYRTVQSIAHLRAIFPEAADLLDAMRLSVHHQEDPMSSADLLRERDV